MIIKRVYIKNFFLINEIDIEIGEGLIQLIGQNLDDEDSQSNGSGKSSFCEAILWGLTGQTIRHDLNKNDVIGPHDKYAEVILDIEKDGQFIKIKRFRNKPSERNNDPYIFVDGQDISNHKNTDEKISQVLGFNYKTLLLSAYSSSREDSFCKLSSAKRMSALKDALNLSIFDSRDTWLKDAISQLNKEIDVLRLKRQVKLDNVSNLRTKIENLNEKFKVVKRENDQKIARLESENLALLEKIEKLKPLLDKREEGLSKMKDLENKIIMMGNVHHQYEKLENEFSEYARIKEKNQRLFDENAVKLENAEKAYNNLTSNISGECAYCGSHLTSSDSLSNKVKKYAEEMDLLRVNYFKLNDKLTAAKDKYETAKLDREKLLEKKREFDSIKESISKIDKWLVSINQQEKDNIYNIAKIDENKRLIEEYTNYDLRKDIVETITSYKKEEQDILDSIKVIDSEIEELEVTLKDHLDLREINKRVKKDKLDDFVSDLSDSINFYLERICGTIDCIVVQEKDYLELKFARGEGDYKAFSLFSDGESAKINKSVMFALNDLFKIDFAIDDEGLGALDSSGAAKILNYLSEESRMGTMFFVSHDTMTKELLSKFKTITVKKENGVISIL